MSVIFLNLISTLTDVRKLNFYRQNIYLSALHGFGINCTLQAPGLFILASCMPDLTGLSKTARRWGTWVPTNCGMTPLHAATLNRQEKYKESMN